MRKAVASLYDQYQKSRGKPDPDIRLISGKIVFWVYL